MHTEQLKAYDSPTNRNLNKTLVCLSHTSDFSWAIRSQASDMNPFKLVTKSGSPAPSHICGCPKTFPFAVAETPKIGDPGEEVLGLKEHQGAE